MRRIEQGSRHRSTPGAGRACRGVCQAAAHPVARSGGGVVPGTGAGGPRRSGVGGQGRHRAREPGDRRDGGQAERSGRILDNVSTTAITATLPQSDCCVSSLGRDLRLRVEVSSRSCWAFRGRGMVDSAPCVDGGRPRRRAPVPRPLGGDVAPLRLGAAGPANCGWVGSGDAAGAAGQSGRNRSRCGFLQRSRQIGPSIARESPPTPLGRGARTSAPAGPARFEVIRPALLSTYDSRAGQNRIGDSHNAQPGHGADGPAARAAPPLPHPAAVGRRRHHPRCVDPRPDPAPDRRHPPRARSAESHSRTQRPWNSSVETSRLAGASLRRSCAAGVRRGGPGGSTSARRRTSRAMASRSWAVCKASSAESSSSSTARIRAASRTYCETLIPWESAARAIVVYARSAKRIVVACRATDGTLPAARAPAADNVRSTASDTCDSIYAIAVADTLSSAAPPRGPHLATPAAPSPPAVANDPLGRRRRGSHAQPRSIRCTGA